MTTYRRRDQGGGLVVPPLDAASARRARLDRWLGGAVALGVMLTASGCGVTGTAPPASAYELGLKCKCGALAP